MTAECKNRKNIYNRKGFYGIDGWGKMWLNGETMDSSIKIKKGD